MLAAQWLASRGRWEPEAALLLVRARAGEPLEPVRPAVLLLASVRCAKCRRALADFAGPELGELPVARYVLLDGPLPSGLPGLAGVPFVVDRAGGIRGRLGIGSVPAYFLFDARGVHVSTFRRSWRASAVSRWIRENLGSLT
jgi:hypothetical protein